jgi:hypothetical protein
MGWISGAFPYSAYFLRYLVIQLQWMNFHTKGNARSKTAIFYKLENPLITVDVGIIQYLDSNSFYQRTIQLINYVKLLDFLAIAYNYEHLAYIVMVFWVMTLCRLESAY